MKILKVFENNPNPKCLDMTVEALRDGDIVIYPTDTLYAIGCDALNNSAINKICKLKGINPDKTNLSIICDGISMVAEYARFDNRQFKVLKTNLPGPFTFILPSSSSLPKVFKGRKTVGIRVPENNVAVELVRRLGNPILSTTISYTDDDYAVNPELIAETYADSAAYLLDGGDGGLIPSTVVDMTSGELEIVREGKGDLIY